LTVGLPSFPARDLDICRAELRLSRGESAAATALCCVIAPPLPKQCRNIGTGTCALQRAVDHAVNVKGVPAKPQYPLRGSDGEMPPRLVMQAWEKVRYVMLRKRRRGPDWSD